MIRSKDSSDPIVTLPLVGVSDIFDGFPLHENNKKANAANIPVILKILFIINAFMIL
jgi:hypothetical protein